MDLKNWLQQESFLKEFSSPQDESKVQNLLAKASMNVGGIELLYDRSPEFQRLLRYQASEYLTVLGENPAGDLLGFFSLSFAKKWISGAKQQCGYIGDFRISNSKQAALIWRKSYPKILQRLQQTSTEPIYFLTAILKKNVEAQKALVNPKKDLGFYYQQIQGLDMVNVYARIPFAKSSSLKAVLATADDESSLREFLHQHEKAKDFGTIFDGTPDDTWVYRSNHWPGFHIQAFLLIKDKNGKIVSCALPWSPKDAKRMTVRRAPRALTFFFKALSLIGFHLPSVGESLSTHYLTHFCVSSEVDLKSARSAFLHWCFDNIKDTTMISYAAKSSCKQHPAGFIQQKVGVLLYAVRTQREPLEFKSDIGFEMGLV